jgi:hypothetical protein
MPPDMSAYMSFVLFSLEFDKSLCVRQNWYTTTPLGGFVNPKDIFADRALVGRTFSTRGKIRKGRSLPFEVLSVEENGISIRNSLGNVRMIPRRDIDSIIAFLQKRVEVADLKNNFNPSYLLGIAEGYTSSL